MAGSTFITVSLRVSTQLFVRQVVWVISKECCDGGTQGAHERGDHQVLTFRRLLACNISETARGSTKYRQVPHKHQG
jgi:hypothetical protein